MAIPVLSATGPLRSDATATPVSDGNVLSPCPTGSYPSNPAYDPVDHDLYVPDLESGSLTILSSTCTLVATYNFGSGSRPQQAAFDPMNNTVYVTDAERDVVYVFSGTTLVDTIGNSNFVFLEGIAFDPAAGLMAVTDSFGSAVLFINGTTVVGLVSVGGGPSEFAYDPVTDRFLVSNTRSNDVTSMNASDPLDESEYITIPTGSEPQGIVFDPADSLDYVVSEGSSNVTVISGLGVQFGSVPVGTFPFNAVWDESRLSVYVVNSGSHNISVIQGLKVVATVNGPARAGFNGIAYDEMNDHVFVMGTVSDKAYVYGSGVRYGPTLSAGVLAPLISPNSVAPDPSCMVGTAPSLDAYDPVTHELYVPNAISGDLSILSGCTEVATVTFPVGAHPYAAAFDPTNNFVYVTDETLSQVYLLSGSTIATTVTSPTFDEPHGATFDPGTGEMAFANYGSNTVTFVAAAAVDGTTTVGTGPSQLAYDPYSDRLLVTNELTDNVTSMNALDPTNDSEHISIPVGALPNGIAFDPADQYDYVANGASDNMSVISGIGTQIGSVPVGTGPAGVAWDPAKLSIYVVSTGSSNISVVQGLTVLRTITGPVGAAFLGIAYNALSDEVCVTGDSSSEVYVYH
jgi:DNA-binding beta-propeller fold protein YncE